MIGTASFSDRSESLRIDHGVRRLLRLQAHLLVKFTLFGRKGR